MDWSLLKAIIIGVFGAAVVISTVLVGILVGSLRTLRDSNNDLRLRVLDLEKQRADDQAQNAALASENKVLKSLISGKVEWTALTDLLEEHHRQALQWWEEMRGMLAKVIIILGGDPTRRKSSP